MDIKTKSYVLLFFIAFFDISNKTFVFKKIFLLQKKTTSISDNVSLENIIIIRHLQMHEQLIKTGSFQSQSSPAAIHRTVQRIWNFCRTLQAPSVCQKCQQFLVRDIRVGETSQGANLP